jgi:hypothetical protein
VGSAGSLLRGYFVINVSLLDSSLHRSSSKVDREMLVLHENGPHDNDSVSWEADRSCTKFSQVPRRW